MKYIERLAQDKDQIKKETREFDNKIAKADAEKEIAGLELDIITLEQEINGIMKAKPFILLNVVKAQEKLKILKGRLERANEVMTELF